MLCFISAKSINSNTRASLLSEANRPEFLVVRNSAVRTHVRLTNSWEALGSQGPMGSQFPSQCTLGTCTTQQKNASFWLSLGYSRISARRGKYEWNNELLSERVEFFCSNITQRSPAWKPARRTGRRSAWRRSLHECGLCLSHGMCGSNRVILSAKILTRSTGV